MSTLHIAAPFVGAVLSEVLHWYRVREKLESAKYRKLLHSRPYWIITTLAVLFGGLSVLILFGARFNDGELLLAGAAFPTLLRKVIAAFVGSPKTVLGTNDRRVVTDYFAVA
ncbi:hypothetical protein AB0M48_28035 [Lentzea sp. NPDC051208]|uniref:hypothetical protein n=1 Tax=Lentzea sp. NPDC051208 TaxID=3154642 RepID=UPI00343B75A5